VHALVLELRDALVIDGGGDDGLAGQFLQAELVELVRAPPRPQWPSAAPCAARSASTRLIGPVAISTGNDQSFT
jgi:hypothetical protein